MPRFAPSREKQDLHMHILEMQELREIVMRYEAPPIKAPPMHALMLAGVELRGREFTDRQNYAHNLHRKLRNMAEKPDLLALVPYAQKGKLFGEFAGVRERGDGFYDVRMVFSVEGPGMLVYAYEHAKTPLPEHEFLERRAMLRSLHLIDMPFYSDAQQRFEVQYLPPEDVPFMQVKL